jgi:hypothetical protein
MWQASLQGSFSAKNQYRQALEACFSFNVSDLTIGDKRSPGGQLKPRQ